MKRLAQILAVGLLIAGLLLLTGGVLPYARLSALLNKLASDGRLESFSPALHQALIPLLLLFGGVSTLVAISPIILPKLTRRILVRLGAEWASFCSDSKAFFQALGRTLPKGWQAILLGIIILVGIFARVVYLQRPMGHDEAYTVMAFANTPLWNLVSDYHLPNNHIFHSLLVHLAIPIFGMDPWAVRLPALLAGVLTIPGGYIYARRAYGPSVAMPAAAALALLPALFDYATNARGYTLIALFSLLGLTLALYLKDHFNRLGWLLLVLFTALGFWTIPIMLYPAGLIWLWLLGSSLLGDGLIRPARMLRQLVLAGLALVGLTALFYLPVFLRSGTGSVLNNPFISSLTPAEFFATLPGRLDVTWETWTSGLSVWVVGLIVLGFSLSIVYHWKITHFRLPLQLTAAAWLATEMLIALPDPQTRYFIFLLPLLLIWAIAGLVGPLEKVNLRRWQIPLSQLVAGGLSLLLLVGGLLRVLPDLDQLRRDPAEIERIAIYLTETMQPGDVVLFAPPMDSSLWYYLSLHELPSQAFFQADESLTIERAFVVVTLSYGQTLESVLVYNQAPPSLDTSQVEWLPFYANNRLALIPNLSP